MLQTLVIPEFAQTRLCTTSPTKLLSFLLQLWLGRILTTLTTLLAFWSSVNVWRGVWSMLDRYFLPGINMEENYVVSTQLYCTVHTTLLKYINCERQVGHLLGLTLLSLSLAANTIRQPAVTSLVSYLCCH